MRYLGWGIGHRNPPDFAHEANALVASSRDKEPDHDGNPAITQNEEIEPHIPEEGEMEGGDMSDVGSEESDIESDRSEVAMYDY